ncbi:MAG: bifunctional 5,10-methylenetetrahydrofolate dehydrogenase/5,10-methenyltetrahydrofolate cyclohydrolase [Firmicutes bacterium]|nr:bifunctional 5,10-methylenetetrahydrofolate dehydrogenase/5,10-methenyltetrahydrofolate cyclohydrolase [Bacillota bacterium]
MAQILKGGPVAEALDTETAARAAALREKGVIPALAILRVGEKPDDLAYERGAVKRCGKIGVEARSVVLPEDVTQQALVDAVLNLDRDKGVHGILVLSPLPKHLDMDAVRASLIPAKDVDGITGGSLAGVFSGIKEGFAPCTAQACIEMLDFYGIDCKGRRAAVLGRSLLVGRPVAMLLMGKHATVTICHTRTVDTAKICREADIVVAAAGKMEAFGAEYFSPGQIVLDVGIHWSEEKNGLCGDVRFGEAEPVVAALSPVPGGVGSVTTSVLARHVVDAAGTYFL